MDEEIVRRCRIILDAYKAGKLGQRIMPEDSNPGFLDGDTEIRFAYFTLPMALNYQRDSYNLWKAALETYKDPETRCVFDALAVSTMTTERLREILTLHRLALQPNKHTSTWQTISRTVAHNFGSFTGLIEQSDSDYLRLREIIQREQKKGFPYLSGPKIFNYWCFIMSSYGGVALKNADQIEIAPDTHITQSSVVLGVITKEEATELSKEKISERWRKVLCGSGINPIDMHPPLWFWSRNGFIYKIS